MQYNKRREWAEDVLSAEDKKLFYEKIGEIKQHNREATFSDGKYLLDINNKLIITDADYNDPSIETVMVFDVDNTTEMDEATTEVIKYAREIREVQATSEFIKIITDRINTSLFKVYNRFDFEATGTSKGESYPTRPDGYKDFGYSRNQRYGGKGNPISRRGNSKTVTLVFPDGTEITMSREEYEQEYGRKRKNSLKLQDEEFNSPKEAKRSGKISDVKFSLKFAPDIAENQRKYNDGNVIPLSERFKSNHKDIRHSRKAKPLDNDGETEYNELYTSTDDFIREVVYADRSSFSRSLANRTTEMRNGEIRTLVILCGARAYVFRADGYVHGELIRSFVPASKEMLEDIKNEYNEIDENSEVASLWAENVQGGDGGRSGIGGVYDGGQSTSLDTLYENSSRSNGTRGYERGRTYYKYSAEEVNEIVRRLSEMYNIPDDTANNDSNSKIRHSRKADSEGGHHEGDIITDELLKLLGEDWEVFQAKKLAENKAKAERAKKLREQYFPGLDNGQFFEAIAKLSKTKVYSSI